MLVLITLFASFDHVEVKTIIHGLLYVDIYGYNFGHALNDIVYIKLKDMPCTSILRISSQHLRCISFQTGYTEGINEYDWSTSNEEMEDKIQVWDVELRTVSGSKRGLSLDAEEIVRSKSFRPAITEINFQNTAFHPETVAYIPPIEGEAMGTLYWTNRVAGHFVLQRSYVDGSQIETVLNQVFSLLFLYLSFLCLSIDASVLLC